MAEKKLLSKLLLRRKKYQKKCQKCVNAFKKRGVLVCLCVCFSSVYDILIYTTKVFHVFLISSLIIYMVQNNTLVLSLVVAERSI